MKLKLSELASVAEIIGAFAIVVSLIYVGIQVNDSTRAVRSATANETSAAISSWYAELGVDQHATHVVLEGFANPDSLTRDETAQFIYLMHGLFLQYQAAYYLSQEGTLDDELRESVTNTILGVRDLPGMRLYWKQRGNLFKPNFRQFVEELMLSGSTNTDLEELYRTQNTGE